MIERSLMNLGNTYRIRKAIEKARAGKEVTLAYIGGSITQGAGATPINTECYAYKSYQLFKSRFAMRDNVKFVKAGVGGTPLLRKPCAQDLKAGLESGGRSAFFRICQ